MSSETTVQLSLHQHRPGGLATWVGSTPAGEAYLTLPGEIYNDLGQPAQVEVTVSINLTEAAPEPEPVVETKTEVEPEPVYGAKGSPRGASGATGPAGSTAPQE